MSILVSSGAGMSGMGMPTDTTAKPTGIGTWGPQPSAGPALTLRRLWMKQLGFSAEEIKEACSAAFPEPSLEEEIENLKALEKMAQAAPTRAQISRLTVKYGD